MPDYPPAFLFAVARVLQDEGGASNNPADAGGATVFGISRASHPGIPWPPSKDDAIAIYYRDYWVKFGFDALPANDVVFKLFDLSPNIGWKSAVTCLQRALRAAGHGSLADHGIIDNGTMAALRGETSPASTPVLLAALRSEAAAHYRLIVAAKPTQSVFLTGWLNRAYS